MIHTKEQLEWIIDKIKLPNLFRYYRIDGSSCFNIRDPNKGKLDDEFMVTIISTFKHGLEIKLPITEEELRVKLKFHLEQFARELTQLSVEIE